MTGMIFNRFEKKYIVSEAQYRALMPALECRMRRDAYAGYSISTVYFDTPDCALIRASLEKPVYKEKLRLRCYGTAGEDTTVFVELKRKFKGMTFKRRVALPWRVIQDFPHTDITMLCRSPIASEITAFVRRYPVEPKVFISYDREAFSGGDETPELRVTFDRGIQFRAGAVRLDGGGAGEGLLPGGVRLMEIKTPAAIPLWLCSALSSLALFPVSFSKYGAAYMRWRRAA